MASLPHLLARLGRVIRTLRMQAGYSQERFGLAIGLHRTYMGHLERGTANPTIRTLQQVAQGLGIDVPDLFTLLLSEDDETGGPQESAESRAVSRKPQAARPQPRRPRG